ARPAGSLTWSGPGTSYDEPSAVLIDDGAPFATVTGTAEELERWLWGRGVEPATSGDDATLAALRACRNADMQ
ncbi:MAG TPA: hypothetical protein PLA44_01885, partial [Propionibacteriaceae bacterium]|nr:hypothetical protein [Propionibacteriaceae bacterium]